MLILSLAKALHICFFPLILCNEASLLLHLDLADYLYFIHSMKEFLSLFYFATHYLKVEDKNMKKGINLSRNHGFGWKRVFEKIHIEFGKIFHRNV